MALGKTINSVYLIADMADPKDAEGVLPFAAYAPFTFSPPFCVLCNGKKTTLWT